jgi:chromosomal replication initiation ATPase DnaA
MNNMLEKIDGLMEANHRIKKAVEAACLVCNISHKQFHNRKRERHLVDTRRMVYAFCRNTLELSLVAIGKYFKVNHATVIHHLKVHKQLVQYDSFYEKKYDGFNELVKADIGFVDIENIIKEVRLLKQRQIEKQSPINENERQNI